MNNLILKEFDSLVEWSTNKPFYIGEGNPLSNILIIGKECAIDNQRYTDLIKDNLINERYSIEGLEDDDIHIYTNKELGVAFYNIDSWKKCSIESVVNSANDYLVNHNDYTEQFYPILPHCNQLFQQRRKKKSNDASIPIYINNKGTSATWYFYQWLIDLIYMGDKGNRERKIDFHFKTFHSELSQIPLAMSRDLPNGFTQLRKDGIICRETFFNHPFFKHFSVIVVACGHYPNYYGFNLERVFHVEWSGETVQVGHKWYNRHRSADHKRLLIHTNQMSFVSAQLIEALAREISSHLREQKLLPNR